MRVLLIPYSDRPESAAALAVAMQIAERVDANIVGCHLRPHRDLAKEYKVRGLPLFGSPDKEWIDALGKKASDSATRKAHKSFDKLTSEGGFRLARRAGKSGGRVAIWREKVGLPNKIMAISGPVADLTIVTRPAANSHVGRMFMLAALMQTGRPVLILPPAQKRAPGKRIAIAWNQSAEVARVVSGCMPMLQAAEQVTIISCGSEGRLGPKSRQLKDYLSHYGVDATVRTTKGRQEEKELMGVYKDTGSDLLMMGAYSRARFREMVFGGMTDYMLNKARIPVVMLHS